MEMPVESGLSGPVSYQIAFDLAPIGLLLSTNRTITDCNLRLCEMFATQKSSLVGQSLKILYPSAAEFERTGARIAPLLNAHGAYRDDRVMKRFTGEIFWCHVSGRALNREAPHQAGIWCFEELSSRQFSGAELTPREREVAALLLNGLKTKEIARHLGLSPRTVEIYRASLMHKFKASSPADLVQKLLVG
jgi:DNA-binding CsgD family transcriptional regulator